MKIHSAVILCAKLCIAQQNLSTGVNVVSKGSPSLILRVLLISLGITLHSSDNASSLYSISFSFYDTFDGRQVAAPTPVNVGACL